jgi:ABC-type multidrug transport system fused ATPase/permease subunit
VLVLEAGRIVDHGAYAELLARGQTFSQLFGPEPLRSLA